MPDIKLATLTKLPPKAPKTRKEWQSASPEDVQKLIDSGIVQFSDVPISHPWQEWRQEQ